MQYFRLSEQEDYSLSDVTRFNDKIFAHRQPNKAYDLYRFQDNPFAHQKKDYLYIATSNGSIIGQLLTLPSGLAFNNKKLKAYWGQDYILKEEFRKKGIGRKLLELGSQNKYYMGFGMTSISRKIHKKINIPIIGRVNFYQKWNSKVSRLKHALKRRLWPQKSTLQNITQFPKKIHGFKRITSAQDLHLPNINWSAHTLETLRNKAFIHWRFFYKPNHYFMYAQTKSKQKNTQYFVVQPKIHHNSYWLQVIDYRYDIHHKTNFKIFLSALEQLRRMMSFTGVLIATTLKKERKVLKAQGFTRFKKRIVVSTFPFKHQKTNNYFISNLADSDWAMHNSFGEFNFKQ